MDQSPPDERRLAIVAVALGGAIELIAVGLLLFGDSLTTSISMLALGTTITVLCAVLLSRSGR